MNDMPDAIEIRRWETADNAPYPAPVFVLGDDALSGDSALATVVLPTGGEARAREWFERGAECVLFADAALLDSDLVRRMAETFGSERVGVWLPLKRKEISWSLDTVSNADFKCLTPSVGQPGWEVLKADGSRTGTDAAWWLEKMRELGASRALLSVDYLDEADHNLFAALLEDGGDSLWLSPLSQRGEEWGAAAWREFGGACRLVLPHGMEMAVEPEPEDTEAVRKDEPPT